MDLRTVEWQTFKHRLVATALILALVSAVLPREELFRTIAFALAGIPSGMLLDMLLARAGLGIYRVLGSFIHPSTPVPDRHIPLLVLRVWIVPVVIVLSMAAAQWEVTRGLLAAYGILIGADAHQLYRLGSG